MDIRTLQRNADQVRAGMVEQPDGSLVARAEYRIYVPVRFGERKLAVISEDIRVVAVYAIVRDNQFYAVSSALAMMQITPTSMTIVKIAGDEFYEFYFEPGATITPNLNLVRTSKIAYLIYDEIIAKGHIPWFLTYSDLGKLFVSAKKHAGIALAGNNVPLEMIAASITRNVRDRTQYYRHVVARPSDEITNPPAFVPFRSVIWGATNVTSKLMGSYFDEGLLSSFVNTTERVEDVETLLRK